MKRLNAVLRLTFSLAAMFAMVFLSQAESGEKRVATTQQKQTARSRPSAFSIKTDGRPSAACPRVLARFSMWRWGRAAMCLSRTHVNISVGDTVRWTWAESGHSVTSGPPCVADSQYCSPDDNELRCRNSFQHGHSLSTHLYRAWRYSYHCVVHCIIGMTGVVNVSGGCTPSGWSAGPDMPTVLVRAVGVYFQADGNFYTMGGRISDAAGDDFQHVLQYNPTSNSWTQMASTLPDNQMNNMACGVLAVSGTPLIYCVGGSAAGADHSHSSRVHL